MTNDEEGDSNSRRLTAAGKSGKSAAGGSPPLQFSLRSLLILTAAVAVLFGALRWLEVPPFSSAVVLVVLIVTAAAALGLVAAIAGASDEE